MTLEIPEWQPSWDYTGQLGHVRVTAGHVAGDEPWSCREQTARKARPAIRPVRPQKLRIGYPEHEAFPLGLARTALVSILSATGSPPDTETALARAVSESRNIVPEVSLAAAREAVSGYLAVLADLRETGSLTGDTIVRHTFFAVDEAAGGVVTEWWAWGLLHVSRDSQDREFHLLRWRDAGRRPRSAAYLGLVARVAADAVVAEDGVRWTERWNPAAAQPRAGSAVRIREIGVLDRTSELLVEASADEARDLFRRDVPPALAVLAGGSFNPGAHCASCSVRIECSGLPRMPGMTGAVAYSAYTRRITATDLVAHRGCSWRIHLQRDLGLPAMDQGSSAAQDRGAAVHRWLEQAHGRGAACTAADLPDPVDGVGPVAELLQWDVDRYRAARPFLLAHLDGCPLGDQAIAALPEWSMTAWDTDVDAIMSSRADLVVDYGDRIVVRETKTASPRRLPDRESELMDYFPQVAIAVCMLADGLDPVVGRVVDGDERRPGVVELELLTSDLGQVVRFDAADPETVYAARLVVADLVDRYVTESPTPSPGPACSWCPMAHWCVDRAVPDAPAAIAVEQALELLDAPTGGMHPLDVVLLVDPEVLDDDDIPF